MTLTRSFFRVAVVALFAACSGGTPEQGGGGDGDGGDPVDNGPFEGELGTILFVTQVPVGGLGTLIAPFSNHTATMQSAPRGGDLMIRYPDGTLRNLTREAGLGEPGEMQGANAIAVREPTVHFSGNRALFSMAVGAVTEQYDQNAQFAWQIYEVTGLARGQEVAIRRIEGQPADYNNVSPIYGSDDKILFVSDRPRSGEAHLYPQADEYESQPAPTGIYRLDEATGDLEMIENAPSGVFSLSLDTHGRVLFTKWDHLQRDQQGDSEDVAAEFAPITFADESADADFTTDIVGTEVFPEARNSDSVDVDPALSGHKFNHFFAWEINQDGTEEVTLNHVGRQEWGGSYSDGSFLADPNLLDQAQELYRGTSYELRGDGGAFHIRQDPVDPAWYLATEAPEFGTATGGRIVRLQGDPQVNPEDMQVRALTADPSDAGYFRNPLRLQDGNYVAVHSEVAGEEENLAFRLAVLGEEGDLLVARQEVTGGIERTVSWWDPDSLRSYSGTLWELDPVEVAPRDVPPIRTTPLPEIEQAVFAQAGVDADELSAWLRERELALVISRNVTQRDRNDVQQPFNLRVPGGVSSVATGGTVYDVSRIQFFQADLLRAYQEGNEGRRVLARPMHGPNLVTDAGGPAGSVVLGSDGSMAAFVPARRAMSWQLVAPSGTAVVRERNWVSFRAGEIRVCAACHGINRESQTGRPPPENSPQALRTLLQNWRP